jgi:hypothetical protein
MSNWINHKKPAINIEPNDENKINIITDNKPHDEKFDELKTELKKFVKVGYLSDVCKA